MGGVLRDDTKIYRTHEGDGWILALYKLFKVFHFPVKNGEMER